MLSKTTQLINQFRFILHISRMLYIADKPQIALSSCHSHEMLWNWGQCGNDKSNIVAKANKNYKRTLLLWIMNDYLWIMI